MRLSACLIARNEEQNLGRALRSIQGVCDEIVLADTGSTDDTVTIARQHGARVIDFPWRDDFAAARNFTIEHARGEWILWLDADEELLPQSHELIPPMLSRADALGWLVLRQDLVRADRLDLFTEMWQLRLFRRRGDLRFVGRCHADFGPPLHETAQREGKIVGASQVRLRHYGFIEALRPAKLQRAAKLLELELRDRPGQLYYLIEFGRTLLALGDAKSAKVLDEATATMLRHRNDAAAPTAMVAALLEYLLLAPASARAGLSPQAVRELAQRWFPRSPPLMWASARQLFESGEFPAAAEQLEKLLRLVETDNYDRSISFDPRMIGDDARLNLGVSYVRLAELERAEKLLRPLLNSESHRARAEQNLAAITTLRREFGE